MAKGFKDHIRKAMSWLSAGPPLPQRGFMDALRMAMGWRSAPATGPGPTIIGNWLDAAYIDIQGESQYLDIIPERRYIDE